jgi:hypothetical protein
VIRPEELSRLPLLVAAAQLRHFAECENIAQLAALLAICFARFLYQRESSEIQAVDVFVLPKPS